MHKRFKTSTQLTAVDLFCGCGGLTLGLKRAGFQILGAIDNDPPSIEVYTENHPEVHVWEKDIRNLTGTSLKRTLRLRKGELDLLAGCPPCQGFSTLRTLNGSRKIQDPRNDLLAEFQRFVEELRPRAVMMENVPGLADDERFSSFIREMRKMGYLGEHRVLNAADYGVPQRRRRLIYLAGLGVEIPFSGKVLKGKTVKDAIGGLPMAGKSGDPVHDIPERRTPKVMDIIRRTPKNGGSRTDLPKRFQLKCHQSCDGFKDVYGRMAWNKVAPTITSGCFNPSKGRFLHPTEDRAITMREAALLQGFPKKYYFSLKRGKIRLAQIIGNALPPKFIRCQAHAVRRYLASQG